MRTRTYADILARQGQVPEALDIYRSLLAKKPSDAALKKKITQLEAELAGLPATPEAEAAEPEEAVSTVAPAGPARPMPKPSRPPPPTLVPTTLAQVARLEKILYRIQARRRR